MPVTLRTPAFRRVWLANLASNAGTWLHVLAAGFIIFEITGSPAAVGALALVTRGPAIVLFAAAGGLADRFDRRRVGMVTFSLQAVAAAALAVVTLVVGPSLWAIYGLTLVMGVGFALSLPALLALLPTLVPPSQLSQAVSINAAGINVARLVGPAVGGTLLVVADAEVCFAVNALSFTALVLTLRRVTPRPVPVLAGPRPGARQALAYARSDPAVRRLLIGMAIFVALAAPVQELAPVVAARLDVGAAGLGFLLTAMGGGALIGAWIFERLGAAGVPRHRTLPLASLVFALGLLTVALSPSFTLTIGAMAFCGVFWIWLYAGTNSSIQLRSPPEVVGRMLGLYQLAVIGPLALGSVVAGLVAERIGIAWSLGLCAGLLGAWGAWSLLHTVPEIDRHHPGRTAAEPAPAPARSEPEGR